MSSKSWTHLCEADGHGEEDHDEGVEGEDGLDVLHALDHLKSRTFIDTELTKRVHQFT